MSVSERPPACGNCGRPIDESLDPPGGGRAPCPVCGSTARTYHVSLSAGIVLTGTVVATATHYAREDVPADQSSEAETIRGRYRAALDWQRLTDGVWLVQVLDENGNVVDGGLGDNPEEALLEVYERLIPPT